MHYQNLVRPVVMTDFTPYILQMQSLGIVRAAAGDIVPRHQHLYPEIHYLKSGQIKLRIGRQTIDIKTNQILFVNAGINHKQRFPAGGTIYYFSLPISKYHSDRSGNKSLLNLLSAPYCLMDASKIMRQNLERLFDVSPEKNIGKNLREQKRRFGDFIREFIASVRPTSEIGSFKTGIDRLSSVNDGTYRTAAKAIAYLKKNYQRQVSMAQLSQYVCLGQRQIERIFKEATKLTPMQYLMEIRLQKALKLLKNTDLKINTVIEASGFKSRGNFFNFFAKRTGMSPGHFRRNLNRK